MWRLIMWLFISCFMVVPWSPLNDGFTLSNVPSRGTTCGIYNVTTRVCWQPWGESGYIISNQIAQIAFLWYCAQEPRRLLIFYWLFLILLNDEKYIQIQKNTIIVTMQHHQPSWIFDDAQSRVTGEIPKSCASLFSASFFILCELYSTHDIREACLFYTRLRYSSQAIEPYHKIIRAFTCLLSISEIIK